MNVRTRYAPSPTGFMHIGNLRTALYEFLIAKSNSGKFVLRIEDTDQNRLVESAVDVIYSTLKQVGLKYDEGPDIGGAYGPYVQSERKNDYLKYAQKLVEEGKAYYCFCSKERLQGLKETDGFASYDRYCRDLPKEEVEKLLKSNVPYVIRQKMPLEGSTTFVDAVFGEISVENKELEDQILIKTDLFPTYNFANVIDDHNMKISHIVRGCEYLSSTPKYTLLYEALGFEIPSFVHLPLIMGKDENGNISKLSKRHGATSFEDLVNEGYLPKAIVNYIAMLGWCPSEGTREIFSLEELCESFKIDEISKSPSVFDYNKLNWFNEEYIRNLSDDEFVEIADKYMSEALKSKINNKILIAGMLKSRISKFSQINEKLDFIENLPSYDVELFINKKNKVNLENSKEILQKAMEKFSHLNNWNNLALFETLEQIADEMQVKKGTVIWPVRIAISGKSVTPGGATEILEILDKEESLKRLNIAIEKLSEI